jgi:hypothetical protein
MEVTKISARKYIYELFTSNQALKYGYPSKQALEYFREIFGVTTMSIEDIKKCSKMCQQAGKSFRDYADIILRRDALADLIYFCKEAGVATYQKQLNLYEFGTAYQLFDNYDEFIEENPIQIELESNCQSPAEMAVNRNAAFAEFEELQRNLGSDPEQYMYEG